jgi:hypothetical protein
VTGSEKSQLAAEFAILSQPDDYAGGAKSGWKADLLQMG